MFFDAEVFAHPHTSREVITNGDNVGARLGDSHAWVALTNVQQSYKLEFRNLRIHGHLASAGIAPYGSQDTLSPLQVHFDYLQVHFDYLQVHFDPLQLTLAPRPGQKPAD